MTARRARYGSARDYVPQDKRLAGGHEEIFETRPFALQAGLRSHAPGPGRARLRTRASRRFHGLSRSEGSAGVRRGHMGAKGQRQNRAARGQESGFRGSGRRGHPAGSASRTRSFEWAFRPRERSGKAKGRRPPGRFRGEPGKQDRQRAAGTCVKPCGVARPARAGQAWSTKRIRWSRRLAALCSTPNGMPAAGRPLYCWFSRGRRI